MTFVDDELVVGAEKTFEHLRGARITNECAAVQGPHGSEQTLDCRRRIVARPQHADPALVFAGLGRFGSGQIIDPFTGKDVEKGKRLDLTSQVGGEGGQNGVLMEIGRTPGMVGVLIA